MKKFLTSSAAAACIIMVTISCAGLPVEHAYPMSAPEAVPPPEMPMIPERPQIPLAIMGHGIISADNLTAFLLSVNAWADYDFVKDLSTYYIEEAALEGVNSDIAFVQMCLETGFLQFGNLVTPDMYNFAGLGATGLPGADGLPERGLHFPDPRTGVRAHIQHLKAYGSTEPLNQELVNPRFRFVTRGIAPTFAGLTGRWATDPLYDQKISAILERLYEFAYP